MGRAILALIAATSILACSAKTVIEPDGPAPKQDAKNEEPGPSTAATLGIPPGHLPPPGQCRVWIPGKPPGHQGPPGSCSALAARVPLNGWLVYRPSKSKKEVEVSVYDKRHPGVVVLIRFYNSNTGKLLREKKLHSSP